MCNIVEFGKIINTVGLVSDIVGAVLVSIEIYNRYSGVKYYNYDHAIGSTTKTAETEEYIIWEKNRLKKMKFGLYALIFGFTMQIISIWIVEIYKTTQGLIQSVMVLL